MGNDFFLWFEGISKLIFVQRPEFLLIFVGVGMAIVIFALSHTPKKLDEAHEIKVAIMNREDFPHHAIIHAQAKNQFWKFITLIEKAGALYFVSASLLAFLITYSKASSSAIPTSYVLIANFAYLTLLAPTILISGYYIFYRLFRYRLH